MNENSGDSFPNEPKNFEPNTEKLSTENPLNPSLVEPPSKNKKKLLLAFFIFAGLLTTIIIFLAFVRKNNLNIYPPGSITPTLFLSPTVTPTAFVIEETKKYQNQIFGFEFEYPSNFQAIEQDSQTEFVINLRALGATDRSGQSILFIVVDNSRETDIIEWFNDPKVRQRGNILFPAESLKFSKTIFGGNAWYGFDNNPSLPEYAPSAKIHWAIANKNKIILLATVNLDYQEFKESIFKILTSFKFPETVLPGEAANEQECLLKGGVWQTWGTLQQEFCQIAASDSGKTCNDGSLCSLGNCISEDGKLPGKCQTYKYTYGCFNQVTKSRLSDRVCID